MKGCPHIHRVVVTDNQGIIVEFYEGIYRKITQENNPAFFAFFNNNIQLKAFESNTEEVAWKSELEWGKKDLFAASIAIDYDELKQCVVTLGAVKVALANESEHKEYYIRMRPYNESLPFVGGETNGQPRDDAGEADLTVQKIVDVAEWEKHFELAGCLWIYYAIVKAGEYSRQLIDSILENKRKRDVDIYFKSLRK